MAIWAGVTFFFSATEMTLSMILKSLSLEESENRNIIVLTKVFSYSILVYSSVLERAGNDKLG